MEFNFSVVLGGVDGTSVEQVQHSQDNHNSEKKREIEHKAQKNIFFSCFIKKFYFFEQALKRWSRPTLPYLTLTFLASPSVQTSEFQSQGFSSTESSAVKKTTP